MGRVIAGIGSSHAPSIGAAFDRGKQDEPDWKPLFDGYVPAKAWLAEQRPDAAILIYNDHGATFFFDKYPTFALGVGEVHEIADEGWGRRPLPPVPGHAGLAWHLANSLVADEFDLTVCQEMPLDHGALSALPMLIEHRPGWAVPVVPLAVNVLQHPLPTARRCYRLGQAIRRAVDAFPQDLRVAVIGTGGLSHQLHGERFGHMNEAWDHEFMERIQSDPESLADLSHHEYMARGGAESVEMIMWLVMRGALSARPRLVHRNYYLPMLTGFGLLVLDDQ